MEKEHTVDELRDMVIGEALFQDAKQRVVSGEIARERAEKPNDRTQPKIAD